MIELDPLLDETAAAIERAAARAYADYTAQVLAGVAPIAAAAAVQAGFSGAMTQELAAAFSRVLERSVGVAELRALPVGEVTLATRLYQQARATAAEVARRVREHAAGERNATALARELYEGYARAGADPLPVKKLPLRRELRELMALSTQDPQARLTMTLLERQVRAQALRTAPLAAAYQGMFDAAIQGASQRRFDAAVRTAIYERNRYFANRIAQTELARAYWQQAGAEFMADDAIEVLQWRINPTHPRADICDLLAHRNAYGLGPGLYPKARAPRPPAHPFCRCKLVSRPDLTGLVARERSGADRAYLRGLPTAEAAAVMGSRGRLQAVLQGEDALAVVNRGRPVGYRVEGLAHRGGENAAMNSRELGRRIVSGLIDAATAAPPDGAARLGALWANPAKFQKHIAKRVADSDVTGVADYARKTFDVLSSAKTITLVEPAKPGLRVTGKVQLTADGWVVLLSDKGRIVTSYPYDPEMPQFRERHLKAGDHLHEYDISHEHRAALAKLFGLR